MLPVALQQDELYQGPWSPVRLMLLVVFEYLALP
jgi:hypothetical protein